MDALNPTPSHLEELLPYLDAVLTASAQEYNLPGGDKFTRDAVALMFADEGTKLIRDITAGTVPAVEKYAIVRLPEPINEHDLVVFSPMYKTIITRQAETIDGDAPVVVYALDQGKVLQPKCMEHSYIKSLTDNGSGAFFRDVVSSQNYQGYTTKPAELDRLTRLRLVYIEGMKQLGRETLLGIAEPSKRLDEATMATLAHPLFELDLD